MPALSKVLKTGIVAGLSSVVLAIAPNAAMANGGNWAVQLGGSAPACYGYTNWTGNHVTGKIYSQAGDNCFVTITQWWRSSGVQTGADTEYTWGSGTTAVAPHNSYGYYYYGPAGNNDYLCVGVYVQDNDSPPPWYAFVTYGSGC
ncbi:hypothetical protein ATKI12_4386 [Kitasatospora sp. Ki12]